MVLKKFFALVLAVLLVLPFGSTANALSAASAVLIDGDTGEVLYENNKDIRLSMASTTKIMTALLLCENKDLSEIVTVGDEVFAAEGTSLGLKKGMKVSCKTLLYGMMLASGNDAANTAAVAVSGSVSEFVKLMNNKAKELGLVNTNFNTPSGLDGETHYTTAFELAKLTRYALCNKDFATACSTKRETVDLGGVKVTLTNHNRLLNTVQGVIGVKTGFTKKSGRCLVSAAKRNGVYLIAVTLKAPSDWNDHKEMLNYGFSVVKPKEYSYESERFSCEVISGEKGETFAISDAISFSVGENALITRKVHFPKFVYAPIKSGQEIGFIEYKNGENLIARSSLVCTEDIKANKKNSFFENFKLNFRFILGDII